MSEPAGRSSRRAQEPTPRTPPNGAARELEPGELGKYVVIRVADEIVVDLLVEAGGIDFDAAIGEADRHEISGVSIPFASPGLLWKMKRVTGREKDVADLVFLRSWFASRGLEPPGE